MYSKRAKYGAYLCHTSFKIMHVLCKKNTRAYDMNKLNNILHLKTPQLPSANLIIVLKKYLNIEKIKIFL